MSVLILLLLLMETSILLLPTAMLLWYLVVHPIDMKVEGEIPLSL